MFLNGLDDRKYRNRTSINILLFVIKKSGLGVARVPRSLVESICRNFTFLP